MAERKALVRYGWVLARWGFQEPITRIIIVKETEHTLTVQELTAEGALYGRPIRQAKGNSGFLGRVFNSWAEAHAELCARTEASEQALILKAEQAGRDLARYRDLKEPV